MISLFHDLHPVKTRYSSSGTVRYIRYMALMEARRALNTDCLEEVAWQIQRIA
jgi:predicted ATPase